jgi:hypothetical protein
MDPLRRLLMGTTFLAAAFFRPEDDEGSTTGDDYEEADEGLDEGEEDDAQVESDDEDDADEGEGDDAGEDEGQEDRSNQVAQRSRGESRIARLANETKEAKRIAAEAKQELENIRRTQNQRPQETAEQRADRLAQMDPDQRTQYLLAEQAQYFSGQINEIRFTAQDSADRTAFEGLCSRNPVAARYKDAVETELQRLRATGSTAPRETILKYVIGDKALAGAPKARARAERAAAANRTRQSAKPSSSRSDVGSSSGRGGSEAQQRVKRLENINI